MSNTKVKELGQREAPPIMIIIGVVLLALLLGAGGYYAYNGGWKTSGQQDFEYTHTILPVLAARKGDMAPLEAENKLRKEHGQPALEVPKDVKGSTTKDPEALRKLQEQLQAKGLGR